MKLSSCPMEAYLNRSFRHAKQATNRPLRQILAVPQPKQQPLTAVQMLQGLLQVHSFRGSHQPLVIDSPVG